MVRCGQNQIGRRSALDRVEPEGRKQFRKNPVACGLNGERLAQILGKALGRDEDLQQGYPGLPNAGSGHLWRWRRLNVAQESISDTSGRIQIHDFGKRKACDRHAVTPQDIDS
jgi:hypothetical protein